jgi:hypothetical protein
MQAESKIEQNGRHVFNFLHRKPRHYSGGIEVPGTQVFR